VTAVLKRERQNKPRRESQGQERIEDDMGFGDWYQTIEDDLLDASHDEYRWVAEVLSRPTRWHF
jgi:hypothetical protein